MPNEKQASEQSQPCDDSHVEEGQRISERQSIKNEK